MNKIDNKDCRLVFQGNEWFIDGSEICGCIYKTSEKYNEVYLLTRAPLSRYVMEHENFIAVIDGFKQD